MRRLRVGITIEFVQFCQVWTFFVEAHEPLLERHWLHIVAHHWVSAVVAIVLSIIETVKIQLVDKCLLIRITFLIELRRVVFALAETAVAQEFVFELKLLRLMAVLVLLIHALTGDS